jgi:hypothetical protein
VHKLPTRQRRQGGQGHLCRIVHAASPCHRNETAVIPLPQLRSPEPGIG